MRLRARRLLVGGEPLAVVIASSGTITKPSERKSTVSALERLDFWRGSMPSPLLSGETAIYESPGKLFKIRFEPDCIVQLDGLKTAIHIWNTKSAKLAVNLVRPTLSLIAQAYATHKTSPDDLVVLSLISPIATYRLSESKEASSVAAAIVEQIEKDIHGGGLPPPAPEDRPVP